MKSKFYTILGNRLKEIRLAKGLTQKQVAKKMGITRAAVGYYENADRTMGVIELLGYCDACDYNPQELVNYMSKYTKLK